MYLGPHVKYAIFLSVFSKRFQHIDNHRSSGIQVDTCGQTDRYDEGNKRF
jgi:hypothetical protein